MQREKEAGGGEMLTEVETWAHSDQKAMYARASSRSEAGRVSRVGGINKEANRCQDEGRDQI